MAYSAPVATQTRRGVYRALVQRKKLLLMALGLVLILSVIADLGLGPHATACGRSCSHWLDRLRYLTRSGL